MNSRKRKMYVTIYENLILLREALIDYLTLTLPKTYKENWWNNAVVAVFQKNNSDNAKQRYEKKKIKDEIIQTDINSLDFFDLSCLLDILKYNWHLLNKNIKPNIIYKIKEIRNYISHPNESNLSVDIFKMYISYIKEFLEIINTDDVLQKKLNKYLTITPDIPKNEITDNEKRCKILELIESLVVTPALNCDKLNEDIKESLTRTLIRFELCSTLEDINNFFTGALGASSRGVEIYNSLHANKLKALEDIRKEYNKIYLA